MYTAKTILLGIFLTVSCRLIGQNGTTLFDNSVVHELRFYFAEENFWDSLSHNWEENIDDSGVDVPYLKANMLLDGVQLDSVGFRQKGLSSHWAASKFKKPFKVDLNEFVTGQNFDGIKKFNLHNGSCDPGMMRDFVGYNILRTAGVRAPRVSFCRLYLNDEYWGLYGIIEQIDKTFTDSNFDNDGTLIKNIGWTELEWEGDSIEIYQEDFQLKTNEDTYDWGSFLNFMDVVNNSSDNEFPAVIQKVFDVDLFLHVLAVDIMTNNWDSYIDNKRNFYLYDEPSGKQFHWIPWDYNLSMGGDFPTGGNPFPPYDSSCYIQANFSHLQFDSTFMLTNHTLPAADYVEWDFGHGQTSNLFNPTITFEAQGERTICLTAWRNDGNQVCQNRRCQKFDLSFNPGQCETILNGSCPYPASDPIFQKVAQQDSYCCEDEWDAVCALQYYEILQNPPNYGSIGSPGVEYDLNFPFLLDDTSKVLVHRLLQVPAFRKRYLDICCLMMAKNFNKDRLFPMIDGQRDLIRPHIYEDPNYVFTKDYFEYDLGNGTGGGGGAQIPSLKWLLDQRFDQVAENLASTGHDCSKAFSPIGWQDVVINEIMASNSEESGIADPAGEYEDWIELYNNTNQAVDLKNFYLTDTTGFRLKWTFPFGTVIAPNGYLIVWADKDEDQQDIHTNFKLSAQGEELMLSHEDGTIIDVVSYFQQEDNTSYARVPNGTGNLVTQYPTFNGNNNTTDVAELTDEKGSFHVYPNPARDFLIVELLNESTEPATITLCNLLGEVVKQGTQISSTKQRFSTAGLTSGVYFIESRQEKSMTVKRVLIQR
jgi:CotH kinase protein/Lamin Tail Domain/Secretion system C-terminal sorting domain